VLLAAGQDPTLGWAMRDVSVDVLVMVNPATGPEAVTLLDDLTDAAVLALTAAAGVTVDRVSGYETPADGVLSATIPTRTTWKEE
jgi:hypothetical protein